MKNLLSETFFNLFYNRSDHSLVKRLWNTNIFSFFKPLNLLNLLILLISCVQIIFIHIKSYILRTRGQGTLLELTTIDLTNFFTLDDYIDLQNLPAFSVGILIIGLFYIGLMAFYLGFLAFKLVWDTHILSFWAETFLSFTRVHSMIFSLPLHSLCLQVIFEGINDLSIYKGYIAGAVIVEAFNFGVSWLDFTLHFKLNSEDHFSRLNNFYVVNIFVLKIVIQSLELYYQFAKNKTQTFLMIIVLSIAFEIITQFSLLLGVPFTYFKYNKIAAVFSSVSFTLSLLNLIYLTILDHQAILWGYNYIFTAIVFSIFIIKMEFAFLDRRRSNVDIFKSEGFGFKYWNIQQFFYFREFLNKGLRVLPEDRKFVIFKFLVSGLVKNLKEKTPDDSIFDHKKSDLLLIFLKKLIKIHHGDELIQLIMAQTLIAFQVSKLEAATIIGKTISHHKLDGNTFTAYHLQVDLKTKIVNSLEHDDQVISLHYYFQHFKIFLEIRDLFYKQIEYHLKIYNSLQQPILGLYDLVCLFHNFFHDWETIDQKWLKYTREYSKIYCASSLVYAFHYLINRHDYEKCRQNISKYRELIALKVQITKTVSFNQYTIFDPKNVSIKIKANYTQTGMITEVSPSVFPLLGFSPDDLIQKNLNLIIPPFFHNIHNSLIRRKCERPSEKDEKKVVQTFAMNAQGYIIPVNIMTCLFPEIDDGIIVYGLIRARKMDQEYIIANEDLDIESYSEGIGKDLKFGIKKKYKLGQISIELHSMLRSIHNKMKYNPSLSKTAADSQAVYNELFGSGEKDFMPLESLDADLPQMVRANNLQRIMREGVILHLNTVKDYEKEVFLNRGEHYKVNLEIKFYEGKCMFLLSFLKHYKAKSNSFRNGVTIMNETINEEIEIVSSSQSGSSSNAETVSENQVKFQNFTVNKNIFKIFQSERNNVENPLEQGVIDLKNFDFPEDNDACNLRILQDPLVFPKVRINERVGFVSEGDELIKPSLNRKVSDPFPKIVKFNVKRKLLRPILKKKSINSIEVHIDEKESTIKYPLSSISSESRRGRIRMDRVYEAMKHFKFLGAPGVVFIFHMLTFYVVCLLITIFMIYFTTIRGVAEMKSTLDTTLLIMKINSYFFKILQGEFLVSLDITYRNSGVLFKNGTDLMFQNSEALKNTNDKLDKILDTLNMNLKLELLNPNIAIYFDEFFNFTTSKSYKVYNFFDASRYLVSELNKFSAKIEPQATDDPWYKFSHNFLNVNLYNDFFKISSILVTKFGGETENQVKTLQMQAIIILLSFSSMSFILHIWASIIFYYFTKNDIAYAKALFGTKYEDDFKEELDQLQMFKDCIDNVNFDDLMNILSQKRRKQMVKHTESENIQKSKKRRIVNTSHILMAMKRYGIMSFSLGISFVVIIVAHVRFISSVGIISEYYNDMIKASEISSQIQITTIEIMKMTLDPGFYVKNMNVNETLHTDLKTLAYKITDSYTHFTFDFATRLSENFCQYKTASFDCDKYYGNGIVGKGIFPTLYYTRSYILHQIDIIHSHTPGSVQYQLNALNNELEDILFFVFDGIAPAISYNVERRRNEIITKAEDEEYYMLIFAMICFVLAAAAGILPRFFIKPYMMRERIGLAKSMLALPIQLVMRNREFKEFLLKDSNDFYPSLRRITGL